MSALREVFARLGIELDSSPLEQGDRAVGGLTDRLRDLGGVLAGGAVVLGLRAFVTEIAATGDELDKSSQALGLSTDALQEWRAAAGHAGVRAEQMTPALQAIRRNAGAAAAGAATMQRDFRRLGVELRDSSGELRGTDDLMLQVADGLQAVESPTERAALAMRLMGEQGARLLPLLSNGSAGVREAAEAFQALGGGMSEESIAAAADYTDRMQDVDDALTGIKSRIAIHVLPGLARLLEALSRGAAGLSRMMDRGRLLEATFGVLAVAAVAAGGSTVAAWIAAAAPFVAVGVAVGALILIVEDLAVGFEGGRSALSALGDDMDEWAEHQSGQMADVALVWTTWRDIIRDVANELARIAGFGDDVLGLSAPEPVAQRANAMEEVRRIRAERAAAEERRASGVVDFAPATGGFTPSIFGASAGGADRVLGTLGGGASAAPAVLAPTITNQVRVQVDASGLSEAEATRVAERAVRGALSAQADDLADTLGQGA